MPTKREREYYRLGFLDGQRQAGEHFEMKTESGIHYRPEGASEFFRKPKKTKRKLSAWNKYIKANAKKPRFRLRSGSPNLKKLAVAFRKTPAGKKKRR